MNELGRMLDWQKELMSELNIGSDKTKINDEILDCILGLTEEVGELAKVANSKRKIWRDDVDFNTDEFKEELVDVMAYLIELFLLLGCHEDSIMELFKNKMIINLSRVITSHK